MNITLSVDDQIVSDARKAAEAMGKTLNQAVRDYLEQLAGRAKLQAEIAEFRALSGRGDSGGKRFDREAIYADRLKRRRGA